MTMDLNVFLDSLRARGISLLAQGEELVLEGRTDLLTADLVQTIRAYKPELVSMLSRDVSIVADRTSWAAPDRCAMSLAQRRLWFMDQLQPGSAFYNIHSALRLEGHLDVAAMQRTLDEVQRRHESLRTRFVDGMQHIDAACGLPLEFVDLSALVADEQQARIEQLAQREAQTPFDLATGPLIRVRLLGLTPESHVMLLTVHHIVADGWSMGVLLGEIANLYAAYSTGQPSPLPPLTMQYADYAHWQQAWLEDGRLQGQLAYWKEQLAGAPELLTLPTDRPRPNVQTQHGSLHRFTLPAAGIQALARRTGSTLFMLIAAGFQLLLSRYSGQQDICIGTPVAGRGRPELEDLIGFFVNTLVLRTQLDLQDSFETLLGLVRKNTLEALANQDVPFEQVVEALQPARHTSHTPLFQAALALQNTPANGAELPGLALYPIVADSATSKFDLTLGIEDEGPALRASFEYNTDLFDAATIVRMAAHLQLLLAAVVDRPDAPVADLPWLTAEEATQLAGFNSPAHSWDGPQTTHTLFEAQVTRTPLAQALAWRGGAMSYAELNARANALAWRLREAGVGPDMLVGICSERGPDMLVAVLAVLKAGAGYLPLDPAYPAERLAYMLEDARPQLVLVQPSLSDRLPAAVRIMALSSQGDPVEEQPNPENLTCAAHLAYVIYTSGSTGRPKGVMLQHGALCNLVHGQARAFGARPGLRMLQFASFNFDASASEFFVALSTGATLVLAARNDLLPDRLENTLAALQVDAATLPPALLASMPAGALMPSTLVVAGEACPAALAAQWRTGRRFINAYGPTEATVCATLHQCGEHEDGAPPIGQPLPNVYCRLLDAGLNPVPVGVTGELYIGGAGLARGYLRQPALTAERFIPDPWGQSGARLYRSGDLARYRPDGSICYLGRIDSQLKLRGFRIEPGEIEAALRAIPDVREAAVVAARQETGLQLIAYVAGEAVPDGETLRAALKRVLPDYMVPAQYVRLATLPLTVNGKLDHKALPAPETDTGSYEAPSTEAEQILVAIWRDVLKVERIGRHDNFFALGGHSLLATQVISQLRARLGTELPLRALFEAPTVSELATRLPSAEGQGRSHIPAAPPAASYPLSFTQERLWFLQQLEGQGAALNMPLALRLRGKLNVPALAGAFLKLQQRHAILRARVVAGVEGPTIVIDPEPAAMLHCQSVSADQVAQRAQMHATRVFDLERGALLAADLLEVAEEEHILLLNLHHIIADGWSMGILADEWMQLYRAVELAPLPLQYTDYAVWQRGQPAQEELLNYWKTKLAGAPELLNLPLDRPREPVQRFDGASTALQLDAGLSTRLRQLARAEDASLFMVLLSGFGLLMARYSGETDIVIGTPSANRNREELERLIGVFLGNLVLRVDLSGQPSFRTLLRRVRATALDAYSHADVPFEHIVDALKLPRDLSRNPLFQVYFNMLNLPSGEGHFDGLEVSGLDGGHDSAKFDMTVYAQDTEHGVHLNLVYNSRLFDGARMEETLRQYAQLLEQACAAPDDLVEIHSLLTPAARLLLPDPTQPLDGGWGGPVHELFMRHARSTPLATAVVSHERRWTYAELDEQSERIACWLQERDVGIGDIVAICTARNATLVAAVMGVLKAGAAFMMLDPAYPPGHLQACLEAAPPSAWLQVAEGALGPEREALVALVPVYLDLRDIDSHAGLRNCGARSRRHQELTQDDVALIAFTSGSTGKPKAVQGRHGPLTHFLPWLQDTFDISGRARFAMLSGLAHDPLQRDIFTTLCIGATLHIPHPDCFMPHALAEWMKESRASIAHLTPAMAQILAEAPAGLALPDLAYVFLVGDVLTRRDVQRLQQLAPKVRIINYYGSTETQRAVSYYDVGLESPAESLREIIPLGRGVRDVQLLVLNAAGQQAGVGEHGEVYLRSPHLAAGYRGDPELTAQRFLPNPFSQAASDRMYRTGDLGRYLPNGMVECMGRVDTQVKLRGFRIELGHVESVLGQHELVREAIVVIRADASGEKQLVAYVVGEDGLPDTAVLRAYLSGKLPDYMRPTRYVALDALPLTPNGKVNRAALPAPDSVPDDQPYVAPATATEQRLAVLWSRLLRTERVGAHDNFFTLGGNSLLAVRLIAAIGSELGRRLPVAQLFSTPTIAALAAALDADTVTESHVVPLRAGGDTPLFMVHPADGSIFCYAELTAALAADYTVYGIQSAFHAGVSITPYTLDAVAAAYARDICATCAGPYRLAGWSLGGTLAMRIAALLEEQGHQVAWVAPFDTVFRGDVVRPGFTLEQYLDDMLADSAYALEARVGDEHVALYQRIRMLAGEIGIPQLAALLCEAPEQLEVRLSFDRALQALLVQKHRDMNDNIRLANGFKPAMLQAPVYSFWADGTVGEGADVKAWHAYTHARDHSKAFTLPGRHGDFILGANASAIAGHLNDLLEGRA
ncbi:amino acid adenylation domain-containing protein [Duganella sp. CY15W]|uniref:non-ribosomal peptide synthetase n=1 Tax=Duganella sp. CY15W TaxID=2692172 RepID=UPI00136BC700|nr:non-ribosomal peptide synthetase [Duganella sp. CY15W]MYM28004.1 amino acid adenylation domain-containing protein [Duganella sp. CY15W]